MCISAMAFNSDQFLAFQSAELSLSDIFTLFLKLCPFYSNLVLLYLYYPITLQGRWSTTDGFGTNRIYDGVEAETRKSRASFQII